MSSLISRFNVLGRITVFCGAVVLCANVASADPITVGDYVHFLGTSGSTGGGAFSLDVDSNGPGVDFLTFCLQRTQYLDFETAFRVGGITDHTDDYGGDDPLSNETAWIYSSFRKGALGGYSVDEIQAAIWVLENEWLTNIGNSAALIQLAQNAVKQGWKNDGVKVLNLFYPEGDRAQDQLTYMPTPEPASLILLGSGLAGMAAAARRRRQKNKP